MRERYELRFPPARTNDDLQVKLTERMIFGELEPDPPLKEALELGKVRQAVVYPKQGLERIPGELKIDGPSQVSVAAGTDSPWSR